MSRVFACLEIVRDYASEQLEERGETKRCRDCHVSYYLTVAEELDGQETGVDHLPLLNRLEEDLDNLRAALAWTIESGQSVVGLHLATALERFWIANARVNEGRKVLEDLLAALGPSLRRRHCEHVLFALLAALHFSSGTIGYPSSCSKKDCGCTARSEMTEDNRIPGMAREVVFSLGRSITRCHCMRKESSWHANRRVRPT